MPPPQLDAVAHHLRQIAGSLPGKDVTDAELLGRYVADRDESAFAVLVERHGGLVWSVCRRLLSQPEDAEDAFQATFLVLIRKAASVRKRGALASWLYGVAYRTSMRAKQSAARRRERQPRTPAREPEQPVSAAALRELQALLDREVERLPEKYRAPFVLCCLKGKSRAEAARELGWKEGTVAGRVAEARQRLQRRLARRGVALSAALCAGALSGPAAGAAPPALAVATLRACAGDAAGAASPGAARLAKAVLHGMAVSKATGGAVFVLTLGLVVGGVAARHALVGEPPPREARAQAKDIAPPKPAAVPAARTDRFGDPLPPGAVARLGTVRFRGVRGCLAFAPGGKLLASTTGSAGSDVTLWDRATGLPVRHWACRATLTRLVFAPDGKRLACSDNSAHTHVFDADRGKELFTVDGSAAVFSGDGKTLVAADPFGTTPQVHVVEAATGWEVRRWPMRSGLEDTALAVGGSLLAYIDQADPGRAQLRDLTTGRPTRAIRLPSGSRGSVALAPDGKSLATASTAGVWLWDTRTGKQVRSWDQRADGPPVFSRDGRRLAWTGFDERIGIGRLWVAECNSAAPRPVGEPVNRFEPPCFSPDGRLLAVVTDGMAVQIREVATGKEVRPLDAHDSPVGGLAFTPDQRHMVSRARTGIFAWEAQTWRLVHRAPDPLPGHEVAVALLPDGRLFTEDRTDDPTHGLFRIRDAVTGREALRFPGRPDVGPPSATVAPGGRYAALRGRAGEICVVDLETACCLYRHDPKAAAGGLWLSHDADVVVWHTQEGAAFDVHVRRHREGKATVLHRIAADDVVTRWFRSGRCVSPDGHWLVVPTDDGRLRRWDLIAGKEMSPLPDPQRTVWSVYWSPDGRLLGTSGTEAGRGVRDPEARRDLRFWDLARGQRLAHLDQPTVPDAVHFSHDGRTLFTADHECVIRVTEAATGRERGRLHGHLPGGLGALALSADGRVLATGGYDTQVLLWDLTGLGDGRRFAGLGRSARLRAAWDALAGADARAAYAALWQLLSDPEGAAALLQERLRPADTADARTVARLIGELDAKRFPAREEATRELERLGESAEPALRRALAARPTPEVRRRVEALLHRGQPPLTGERLRELRGIEVLEYMGTPPARRVLEALSRGAPEARLTQEATASLDRLARRASTNP
jgi:RNA polymerase sigma factor (sigma-70 family)